MLILAMVIEVLRKFHSYYMKVSEGGDYTGENFPPLLDAMNKGHSLIFACLQYFSTVLVKPSHCARLRIIYSQRSRVSFQDWQMRFPRDVDILRRATWADYASFRRQWDYLTRRFGLLCVADVRLSPSARRRDVEDAIDKPICCISDGISRAIVQTVISRINERHELATLRHIVDKIYGNSFTLYLLCRFARLSVASVERLHSLHNSMCISTPRLSLFLSSLGISGGSKTA